ncbi:DNA-entry nuclease [Lactiplantibacillus plantarum]|nr:DNA-entry nuclease [Lactiplantibacillus plantarum]
MLTSGTDTTSSTTSQQSESSRNQTTSTTGNTQQTYKQLAKMTYQSGSAAAIKVNSGKSTLAASQWKNSKIDYGNLDSLNRTTTDTAYLSKANLGRSEGRTAQTWSPTGWHNQPLTVNGKRVYPQNRGHLIAYTLSFNLTSNGQYRAGEDGSLDNPKNLATQTAYSNQKTMQIYEDQVRTALEQGKKVIYRVTTVFRGNELMPRGYWSQAVSTDGSVNFNVYIWKFGTLSLALASTMLLVVGKRIRRCRLLGLIKSAVVRIQVRVARLNRRPLVSKSSASWLSMVTNM